MKQIQQNDLAEEIMNDYIEYISGKKIIINSNNCYYFNQLKDDQFKQAIEKLNNELRPEISLAQAIEYIAHNNSWSLEHEDSPFAQIFMRFHSFFSEASLLKKTHFCNCIL